MTQKHGILGLVFPEVLGSRSTQLRGGFGGYHGRPLEQGDQLAGTGGCVPDGFGALPPTQALKAVCEKEKTVTLRVIPGNGLSFVYGRFSQAFLGCLMADYSAK